MTSLQKGWIVRWGTNGRTAGVGQCRSGIRRGNFTQNCHHRQLLSLNPRLAISEIVTGAGALRRCAITVGAGRAGKLMGMLQVAVLKNCRMVCDMAREDVGQGPHGEGVVAGYAAS